VSRRPQKKLLKNFAAFIGGLSTLLPAARDAMLKRRGILAVADITDDIRTALNLSKDIKGAVITEIDSDSPAAKAGLREGDVIQEVNKQPVKNAKDLVGISKKLKPNEKILIRLWSQGRSGFIALEPK
jgi:S1-C subfamily serine protease